jgi:hypothetical protein
MTMLEKARRALDDARYEGDEAKVLAVLRAIRVPDEEICRVISDRFAFRESHADRGEAWAEVIDVILNEGK